MVCNWILPQFNYMARSLLHPNLILSDFLLGMLASGLVVYIPREACLEGALASGLFSSSWLLELPGQRLWGSPPRPWPRSPLQWTPHWGHSGWALALAREPSHEHPVQPALVAGHPILTSILRCWVPPPPATSSAVPEKPLSSGEKIPLPSHPVSWHDLAVLLSRLKAGPPLTIPLSLRPSRGRSCPLAGGSRRGGIPRAVRWSRGSTASCLLSWIHPPECSPPLPVLVTLLTGLMDIIPYL